MQGHLKKIGARIYLYEKDALVQKVAYVYEDGTESKPLPRFIHLGMVTDTVLFGEECQIRFFVYPFSLRLYDTDVDSLDVPSDVNVTVIWRSGTTYLHSLTMTDITTIQN